jgi:26S proteasome regulatory subunit N11
LVKIIVTFTQLKCGLTYLGGGMPGLTQAPPPTDAPVVDTAEQVYISSLALLKMLKHGRAGVPMEVMGLMLGKFSTFHTSIH